LRLALGARRHDILVQLLAEALGLASAGGLAGVLLGAAGCLLARSHLGLAAEIPVPAAIAAVLFSVTTGLVFGVLPARRASRLSPVTALREQ
jgi:ABC-type antimicrobial peptide transport system permease subunit